ncbi:MAG: pyruvate kinase [Candidatus Moranbacteria bacterium]|nr:pyruvate kinase [Candidatus Moranbacteria bacterium]
MNHVKKMKIVATLGPASAQEDVLPKMMEAGLNVARLNFSHGSFEEHQRSFDMVHKFSKKLSMPVAVLQDLSGPKIRIGEFYQERVMLTAGEEFILTTDQKCVGDEHRASISYVDLPKEIKPGEPILLDDGKKRLEVLKVKGNEIFCKIIVGGETKGRRGVNLPGTDLKISCLTAKDRKDLMFGVKNDVEFMALSFVRKAEDIEELRAILKKKKSKAQIIAKIETPQAIENLDAILAAADGLMVARGDLAVEVPMERVPVLQKDMIKRARQLGKPVIVATQMLESMINSPVPTRAEVNDVANAILDGADAVMLSEESTLGKFPVDAVLTMKRIALYTEAHYPRKRLMRKNETLVGEVVDSVTQAVVNTASEIDAKVIVALTESSFTPRMVSRHRPAQHIVVLTPNDRVSRKMALSFGCYAYKVKSFQYVGQVVSQARKILVEQGFAKKGDRFVIAAGVPFGHEGGTNLMMVETI